MKRCPECRRDYADDTLLYCLEDGVALVQGLVASNDEPQIAILHDTAGMNEAATQAQIYTTDQTAVLPLRSEAEPQLSFNGATEKQSFSARRTKPLIAMLVAATVLVGGFFGYRYFNASDSEQVNSIAVLPFENRSGSADTDYLSDGLADSLIYRLSQIPEIKVSPRSSVFRYKGKEIDAEKIGTELGVDAVMSGRMVQRGDNLTISVELVDVRNKKTLWGEQFERKMSDLLATQREIASAITEKLQLKLTGDDTRGINKRYTDNNEAYQAYLKGRYYWNRRTTENIRRAIEQFKSATERDPNFALAYVGLGDCYAVLGEYGGTPTAETAPQAKAYAERAIALDDRLAEPHATLGIVHDQLWEWAEAEREYKRAIELNPNYATAYHWYSIYLKGKGRNDEAAVAIKKAQEIDPLSNVIGINITRLYQLQNNHDAAIENTLKMIELDPGFSASYEYLGLSYLKLGRNAEALASLEKGVESSNRASVALCDLGYGYGFAGKRAEADAIIKELEEKYARKEANGRYIAGVYAGLGEKDKAFEWLEKDFQSRNGELINIRWAIPYESLRDDPRYKDLLKRMGLPE